jgi:hypothetical protein
VPAVEAAAGRAGGAAKWHEATRDDLWLPGPGATFHGRDRFAPTAAWLLAGGELADLGPRIGDPVRPDLPPPRRDGPPGVPGTALSGRVAWIDRFGNLVTDLPAEWLGDRPSRARWAPWSSRSTASRWHAAGRWPGAPRSQSSCADSALPEPFAQALERTPSWLGAKMVEICAGQSGRPRAWRAR